MHKVNSGEEDLAHAETEQAMLRQTIAQSGEMIAQADRLIAQSRRDVDRPAKPERPMAT